MVQKGLSDGMTDTDGGWMDKYRWPKYEGDGQQRRDGGQVDGHTQEQIGGRVETEKNSRIGTC